MKPSKRPIPSQTNNGCDFPYKTCPSYWIFLLFLFFSAGPKSSTNIEWQQGAPRRHAICSGLLVAPNRPLTRYPLGQAHQASCKIEARNFSPSHRHGDTIPPSGPQSNRPPGGPAKLLLHRWEAAPISDGPADACASRQRLPSSPHYVCGHYRGGGHVCLSRVICLHRLRDGLHEHGLLGRAGVPRCRGTRCANPMYVHRPQAKRRGESAQQRLCMQNDRLRI